MELAALLSRRGHDPCAVSADAFQAYEGLDGLTGKPSPAQLAALEHRLISCVPVGESFSVARYAQMAHAEVDSLLQAGRTPIVVGGTGLYLRAALAELDLRPRPKPGARERYERLAVEQGPEALHALLAERNPEAAEGVHPRDRKRLVRYLELLEAGQLDPRPPVRSQLWSSEFRHPTRLYGLALERDALFERIDRRVEATLAGGAAAEVAAALEASASRTARQAVGFAELERHLDGEMTLEEVGVAMKRRTRALARRQLTWMRKLAGLEPLDRTGLDPRTAAARSLAAG